MVKFFFGPGNPDIQVLCQYSCLKLTWPCSELPINLYNKSLIICCFKSFLESCTIDNTTIFVDPNLMFEAKEEGKNFEQKWSDDEKLTSSEK